MISEFFLGSIEEKKTDRDSIFAGYLYSSETLGR